MVIDNPTTFLHTFFFGCDSYSADVIDKKVEPFIVQVCIDRQLIKCEYDNGKRMYRILPNGKKTVKMIISGAAKQRQHRFYTSKRDKYL